MTLTATHTHTHTHSPNKSGDADTTLVNMFLLTYRSFVTSHDLLTLLVARYARKKKLHRSYEF
jgi:hypothetical protein